MIPLKKFTPENEEKSTPGEVKATSKIIKLKPIGKNEQENVEPKEPKESKEPKEPVEPKN